MPAYWIARAKVNDPATYRLYADQAGGIVASFGGRFLARGGAARTVEGPQHFTRYVVAEFPTMEAALACHASDAYNQAATHRRGGAGEVEIVIVEGV